jgi:segregation and condensation protein B
MTEKKNTEIDKKNEEKKIKEDLNLLEAALYVAGRPLDLKTLGHMIHTRSKKKVIRYVEKIVDEYKNRGSSLEVLKVDDNRFVLQLKVEYSSKVKKLSSKPLLTTGPLKTLSYIAYSQPITKKLLTDVRGRHAYGHIKKLINMKLVVHEKIGKKRVLRTTDYFADYFGLSHDPQKMKRKLKKIFSDILKK